MQKTKRKSKYPPYHQGRAQALDLQLNSRQQYIDWHTRTDCKYLPRYPERVYKDWVSWNDWLGTANVFKGDAVKQVRPFWDAVKFAQSHAELHNINTMAEWLLWCKEHSEELPDDIPAHPDVHYAEWQQVGWKGWLGTDVRARLAAARHSTALLCLCSYHTLSKPGNIYAVVHADRGEGELRQVLAQDTTLRVVRAYKIGGDDKEIVMDCLNHFGRQEAEGWFIPNINDLLFELDNRLTVFVG